MDNEHDEILVIFSLNELNRVVIQVFGWTGWMEGKSTMGASRDVFFLLGVFRFPDWVKLNGRVVRDSLTDRDFTVYLWEIPSSLARYSVYRPGHAHCTWFWIPKVNRDSVGCHAC